MSASCWRCVPCDKMFSGHIPYQMHLESAKHKKKAGANYSPPHVLAPVEDNARNNQNGSEFDDAESSPKRIKQDISLPAQLDNVNVWKCDACDVICSSQNNLEDHLKGAKHRKKLDAVRFHLRAEIVNVASDHQNGTEQDIVDSMREKEQRNSKYLVCNTCDISFTGRDNYEQHMKGVKHYKKLKILNVGEPSKWPCNTCEITYYDLDAYNDHMASEGHKAKEELCKSGIKVKFPNDSKGDDQIDSSSNSDAEADSANGESVLRPVEIVNQKDLQLKVFNPDEVVTFT